MKSNIVILLSACACLASCGGQADEGSAQPGANGASASEAQAPATSDPAGALVYPGAQANGDHFSTPDPVDRVVAWYWDESRPLQERGGRTWAVSKPERRDSGYLVNVALVDDTGASFLVYLEPGANGGTDGRIRRLTDEEMRSGVKL